MKNEFKNNQIPLRLVFSLMIATMAGIVAAFLAFAGVRYGFKWPGLLKSVFSGVLLIACLTYGVKRGDKDLKLMREMPPGDKQVGIAHAGLIMLFIIALAALAMWMLVGPPQSSVIGPLGRSVPVVTESAIGDGGHCSIGRRGFFVLIRTAISADETVTHPAFAWEIGPRSTLGGAASSMLTDINGRSADST